MAVTASSGAANSWRSRKARNSRTRDSRRTRSAASIGRVEPPGSMDCVCGHLPPSVPSSVSQRCRAAVAARTCSPWLGAKRRTASACQAWAAYTGRVKSGMKNK